MEPVTIALGLAQLLGPKIAAYFGGDSGEAVANEVLSIARKVTGQPDNIDATEAIYRDPVLAAEFKRQVLDNEHKLKAFYWDNIADLYRGLNEKKKEEQARSRYKIESSYDSEFVGKSLRLDFIEVIKESGQQFPALEKILGINIDTQIFDEPAKKNILVLIPGHKEGKLHKNEIVWMDKTGEKHTKSGIGNTPFDFLYYIAS